MKRFVMAIALTCVLSVSALAGDVPIVPSPAPTQTTSVTTTVVMAVLSLLYS
jgi:hypothetical protein